MRLGSCDLRLLPVLLVLLFAVTATNAAGWGAYTTPPTPAPPTAPPAPTNAPTKVAGEVPVASSADQGESSSIGTQQLIAYILMDAVLLCGAALFAGLTLSVMGLDTLSLEIIATSGQEPDKSHAAKILPIRLKGNQLLCTLVLGNVMVNTLIAQITDRFARGVVGIVLSTALITLGGEILPQATMAAHALKVGSSSAPLVKFFLVLFYPICKPLALFLDFAIGVDPGQVYQREELKKLFALHAKQHSDESGIQSSDVDLIVGAMDLQSKCVEAVMTPISEVFMMEASERLDDRTLQLIWQGGHSRIPVYKGSRSTIVGLLYAKDLLMVRPEEGARVHDVVKFHRRSLLQATNTTKLVDMLKDFQLGRSHIALVKRVATRGEQDPVLETVGVVTMDDVIASLIGDDERSDDGDETTAYLDEEELARASSGSGSSWVVAGHLATHAAAMLYGSENARSDRFPHVGLAGSTLRLIRAATLPPNHRKAIACFLREIGGSPFAGIDTDTLIEFIQEKGLYYEINAPPSARGLVLSSRYNAWLYKSGIASNFFTLVVSGVIQVVLPASRFQGGLQPLFIDLQTWSTLGMPLVQSAGSTMASSSAVPPPPSNRARSKYVPDYSARVVTNAAVLQFHVLDLEALFTQGGAAVRT